MNENAFYYYDWPGYKDPGTIHHIAIQFRNNFCNGNGRCIKQLYFNTFTKDMKTICLYNCEKVKCRNHIICNNSEPKWAYELNDGLCNECNINHGKWKNGTIPAIFDAYCPICMETKQSVKLPRCTHSICIECYRTCNMSTVNEQPKFPYDDSTYLAYTKNPFDNRWRFDTLISTYEKKLIRWNRNKVKYPDSNLMACCICRK